MIQWLNKEKNESMRTKRPTFNTNKYATYRDPSLMQNVTPYHSKLSLKTVFGKIKQEETYKKYNPEAF